MVPFGVLLKKLINSPQSFDGADAAMSFAQIMDASATQPQIAAFVTALKMSGADHRPDIIAASAHEMRKAARAVHGVPGDWVLVDIVGTGGDGHDTFNVSTTAGLVAAGAGCRVAKHGSRASSSACGSADILEAVGCNLDAVTPEQVVPCIDHSGFAFLFAQTYHPAMRHVAKTRKELGVSTLFNLLGPLSNPVKPKRCVVGVFKRELGLDMARSLQLLGVQRALVVCGHENLDEISPAGPTDVWNVTPEAITTLTLAPEDVGLPRHALSTVSGGDKEHNAQLLRQLLAGDLSGPIVDFVTLNAAALILVSGLADRSQTSPPPSTAAIEPMCPNTRGQFIADLKRALELARASLSNGQAKKTLEDFSAFTRR
ncbi:anthranilate phosphoribosyltransferase [Sorochytrium milnesiophthora]